MTELYKYEEFLGQEEAMTLLKSFMTFFAQTGGTPGHILLVAEEGMGKATLAGVVACELKVCFQSVDASNLEIIGDLNALLTNLRARQILLLSNLQNLRGPILKRFQQVLREEKLAVIIGMGSSAKLHLMDIKPFTLVATCQRKSECPPDLLTEFSLILTLNSYSQVVLVEIAESIGRHLGLSFEQGVAEAIERCCDGRPSHLELMIRRISKAINKKHIENEDVTRAFSALGIRSRLEAPTTNSLEINRLSGRDFEHLISELLTRMGFQQEMTKTTGDGGIDIIATLDRPFVGGRYLFQCKRFAPENMIGSPTVRDFYGAVTADRAVKGVFITTSSFSSQAREFGEKVGIELVDLVVLQELLVANGLIDM